MFDSCSFRGNTSRWGSQSKTVTDETPYRLAYEEALYATTDQAGVLDGLRARAGTILAAAAIVTSFLGGQALATDRIAARPPVGFFAWLAISAFILSALCTLWVLMPFGGRISLSAREILAIVEARLTTNDPVSVAETYQELALRHEINYEENAQKMKPLFWAFRGAVFFLTVEVGFWVTDLWRT